MRFYVYLSRVRLFKVCCNCMCQRLQFSMVSTFCLPYCLWVSLETINSMCLASLSVVIICHYTRYSGTVERKHSIILWLNLRLYKVFFCLFLGFFSGPESLGCDLHKFCLDYLFFSFLYVRREGWRRIDLSSCPLF